MELLHLLSLLLTVYTAQATYDPQILNNILRTEHLDPTNQRMKEAAVQEVYSSAKLKLANDTSKHSVPTVDWVKKVHIISMNHLDVGYDGIPGIQTGFINNVLHYYFHQYFPRAVVLGDALKAGGYVESFIYTTHPWLVSMYLHCPENFWLGGIKLVCPNETEVSAFKKGVLAGTITWHAGPMNLEPEFAPNALLFEAGLNISFDLDKEFGIKRQTRVLSQRDVPGMTQTVIPILKKKGISGVTVGVNNMTPPPGVPKMFRWGYNGDEVLATWHPGGYPDTGGVAPTHPGGLSVNDCVVIPNFPEALCFAFRSDNQGPPKNVEEILGNFEVLRAEFPNAHLQASKLEDFMMAVESIRDQLPLITNEIGDTWIQGVASDPKKCAEVRGMGRVMKKCFESGRCSSSDQRVWNSTRIFVKTFEHTWGLAEEQDFIHWSNTDFHRVQTSKPFQNCANAWQEQRQMLYYSIQALADHPVVKDIETELYNLSPVKPDLTGYAKILSKTSEITCPGGMVMQFADDGSIQKLSYKGLAWATATDRLGQFIYQSYNETDFDEFGKVYNYNNISAGYYKHNVTKNAHPKSKTWPVKFSALYESKELSCDFYVQLTMSDDESWQDYGAPREIWIRYQARTTPGPGLDITLQLFDKTSTRLPEAITFFFQPTPQKNAKWMMSKLGNMVDPLNVIINGSQYEHVLDDHGICYGCLSNGPKIQLTSPDVPLAILSTTDLPEHTAFPAPLVPIQDTITGVGFNVYNNIWDTNYIFWYPYLEDDNHFKARFSINLSE